MNQLEVLRESLGQCDEIILDALLMRNRIVEDIMVYNTSSIRMRSLLLSKVMAVYLRLDGHKVVKVHCIVRNYHSIVSYQSHLDFSILSRYHKCN